MLRAEPEVLDVPLARDVGRCEIRDDDLLEALADAVVAGVVDRGLVAAHRRRHARHLDDVEALADVGDRRARTARTRRRHRVLGDVGAEAAGRAERPGADGLPLAAEVDRVDSNLVSAGVERRARARTRAAPGPRCAGRRTSACRTSPGVGIEPREPDVERDAVVEQRVVREDPEALEHADPVLALQVGALALRQPQRRVGRAVGVLVVIGGDGQLGGAQQLGQRPLDLRDPVPEHLDLLAPADGLGEQASRHRARERRARLA